MNLLATVAPQWHRNREVAREAYELLYRASTALSGTIVRMRAA